MRRTLFLVVFPAVCLTIFGQTPGVAPSPVEVNYRGSAVEWIALIPAESCLLTISGPDRFFLKRTFASGARPAFSSVDEQGLVRPDGTYRWELVVESVEPKTNLGADNNSFFGVFSGDANTTGGSIHSSAWTPVGPRRAATAIVLLVFFLYLTLSVLVFSQTASQCGARSRESARTGSESHVLYGKTAVEWPTSVPRWPIP